MFAAEKNSIGFGQGSNSFIWVLLSQSERTYLRRLFACPLGIEVLIFVPFAAAGLPLENCLYLGGPNIAAEVYEGKYANARLCAADNRELARTGFCAVPYPDSQLLYCSGFFEERLYVGGPNIANKVYDGEYASAACAGSKAQVSNAFLLFFSWD